MNRTTFFATILGLAGIAYTANANGPKTCHCKAGECKKADCKDCKTCGCKKPPFYNKKPHGHGRPDALTPAQLQKLKKAREEYMKKVKSIVGEDRFEHWQRLQRSRAGGRPSGPSSRPGHSRPSGPSGRPGHGGPNIHPNPPQRLQGRPTRPQLRKPQK